MTEVLRTKPFGLDTNVEAAVEFTLGEIYLSMHYLQKRAQGGLFLHPRAYSALSRDRRTK